MLKITCTSVPIYLLLMFKKSFKKIFLFSLFCPSPSVLSHPFFLATLFVSSVWSLHSQFLSVQVSHTVDKTTICLLSISFITQMMNNHLCCQSTNMSGYRNNSPEAATPKQFKTQPDSHPSCLNDNSIRHFIWKYIYLCIYRRHCFFE